MRLFYFFRERGRRKEAFQVVPICANLRCFCVNVESFLISIWSAKGRQAADLALWLGKSP